MIPPRPGARPASVKLPSNLVVTPIGIRTKTDVARNRRPLRWWRASVVVLVGLLLALLVGVAIAAPAGDAGGHRVVEIRPHSSLREIAEQLVAQGLLRSPRGLHLVARLRGIDQPPKAGTYTLPKGAWAWTVFSALLIGPKPTTTVTVPEGASLQEIATLMQKVGLASHTHLLAQAQDPELLAAYRIPAKSVEGFLYPGAYTFADGLSERRLLGAMLERFFVRLEAHPAAKGLSRATLLARVTLASMVELETDSGQEFRIAGVYQNRLAQNRPLNSWATVQYALQSPGAPRRLRDLRTQSPYNTFVHKGLPPGPIGNPGPRALLAALAPEKHDFIFFVSPKDGAPSHLFSKSYAAHRAALRQIPRRTRLAAASMPQVNTKE